jgi:hypothetical protein
MNDETDKPKVTGKALQVNDNSANDREQSSLAPKQQLADKSRKVEGNALRVNDNSVERKKPTPSLNPLGKE